MNISLADTDARYKSKSSILYISDRIIRIFFSETYSIKDTYFYRGDEIDKTGIGWSLLENNLNFTDLPSNFELTCELKTTGVTSGNEHRVFITPTSVYDANAQPPYSVYFGYDINKAQFGTRTTSSNNTNKNISNYSNTFHSFKITKNGSSFVGYVDDSQIASKTLTQFSNYSEFTIAIRLWADGTFTIKNLQINAL